MKKVMCMVTLGLLLAGTASAADLTLSIERTDCALAFSDTGAVYTFDVKGLLSDVGNRGLAAFGFDLTATKDGAPFDITGAVVEAGAGIPTFDDGVGLTNPAGFGGTPIGNDLIQIGGAQNTIDNGPNPPYPAVPTGTPDVTVGLTEVVLATVTVTLGAGDAGDYVFSVGNGFANVINPDEDGPVYAVTAVATVTGADLVADENTCPWDLSFNGMVDPVDVGIVKQEYGCTVGVGDCDCDRADVSFNGGVDPVDVGVVKQNYGSCP